MLTHFKYSDRHILRFVLNSCSPYRTPTSSTRSALPRPRGSHVVIVVAGQVWVSVDNGIAYVHSDFYNGAASTCQCKRLTAAIQEVGRRDSVKVIMLMGGENSYGNGINLNTIEASTNPQMVRLGYTVVSALLLPSLNAISPPNMRMGKHMVRQFRFLRKLRLFTGG